MHKDTEISLIIATFNSEKTIDSTLDSIIRQEYSNFELIILDGNSTDSTVELLKLYKDKFEAKGIPYIWMSENDSGIYDAWNKGLKLAQGNWVSFIGSDDCLYEWSLKFMSRLAKRNPDVDFISARAKIVLNDKVIRDFGERWRWNKFKKEMKVLHSGGWHNTNYFRKYGNFNASYKIAGDYEMLLRAKSDLKTAFNNNFIIEMDAGGTSDRNVFKALKEAFKAKTSTANRPYLVALTEMYFIYLKIILKRIFR